MKREEKEEEEEEEEKGRKGKRGNGMRLDFWREVHGLIGLSCDGDEKVSFMKLEVEAVQIGALGLGLSRSFSSLRRNQSTTSQTTYV